MSAYIVSNDTIILIAVAYTNVKGEGTSLRNRDFMANQTAKVLLRANYASVNYRYEEGNKPHEITITGELFDSAETDASEKPMDVIGCCRCLDYQSCEHPEWEKRTGKTIIDTVMMWALGKLPGYSDSKWGLEIGELSKRKITNIFRLM
ncbi:hypothetical protein KUV95_12510 [Microbulbifer agarilyticus]|uniref:hypothetical protein n=1 Tax=Microbulbifer agarilyticus TaxID=260552 RepID=UPI001C944180|nr:hypothetical protein [Microbulbifer agarilyticus]MBY6212373.1 hypothetical protein [Microbulbifer agarilyticus]